MCNWRDWTMAAAVLVLLSGGWPAVADDGQPYRAGFTIYDFERQPVDRDAYTVTVAVWYPTDAAEQPLRYGARPVWGRAAPDAPPATSGAPYPLVIFSHGYGGSGIGSAYLTEHLARAGFVVAAPDHADRHQANRIRPPADVNLIEYLAAAAALARSGTGFDRSAHAYRPQEVALVIDRMLAIAADDHSPLHGMVDPERIGMAGHSLGAFTTLACAGAGRQFHDPRIKAAISISGGVFMWTAEDYATLQVPIMIMYGELEPDEHARIRNVVADHARAYENCRPPKIMFVLQGAVHASFAQTRGLMDGRRRDPELQQRQYATISRYCAAMFDRYLKGDLDAGQTLLTRDPMFTDYRVQLQ